MGSPSLLNEAFHGRFIVCADPQGRKEAEEMQQRRAEEPLIPLPISCS